jgi:hypothetical protein
MTTKQCQPSATVAAPKDAGACQLWHARPTRCLPVIALRPLPCSPLMSMRSLSMSDLKFGQFAGAQSCRFATPGDALTIPR